MTAVDAARTQFALLAGIHFLFVLVTLGLGPVVAIFQTRWALTGREVHERATRFWGQLYLRQLRARDRRGDPARAAVRAALPGSAGRRRRGVRGAAGRRDDGRVLPRVDAAGPVGVRVAPAEPVGAHGRVLARRAHRVRVGVRRHGGQRVPAAPGRLRAGRRRRARHRHRGAGAQPRGRRSRSGTSSARACWPARSSSSASAPGTCGARRVTTSSSSARCARASCVGAVGALLAVGFGFSQFIVLRGPCRRARRVPGGRRRARVHDPRRLRPVPRRDPDARAHGPRGALPAPARAPSRDLRVPHARAARAVRARDLRLARARDRPAAVGRRRRPEDLGRHVRAHRDDRARRPSRCSSGSSRRSPSSTGWCSRAWPATARGRRRSARPPSQAREADEL